MDQKTAKNVARALLNEGAVKFYTNQKDAVKLKCGISSPIDCRNWKMSKSSECYNPIVNGFMDVINNMWDECDPHEDIIFVGVPMGGLFWASCTAFDFGAGYTLVHKEINGDKEAFCIDGHPLGEGAKVIIIEDVVASGTASLEMVDAVRTTGAEVIGVAAIVTYGWPQTIKRFAEANVKLRTLTDYATIVQTGIKMKLFSPEDGAVLENWYHAPENWGE